VTFRPALPHDPVETIAPGVHAVRGTFRMGPGMSISRTMTLLESDHGLVVLNAVRLSEEGEAALEKLGPVTHLVTLSESHGVDEPYFAHRYSPTVWAVPGMKLRAGVQATRELGTDSPIAGARVLGFPGTSGWKEVAYLTPQGGGTLVTCDALQNHVDGRHSSSLARALTGLMGFKGGLIVAAVWRRYQKVQGAGVRSAFAEVSERAFANLITGHGPAITGGADEKVRRAIEAVTA